MKQLLLLVAVAFAISSCDEKSVKQSDLPGKTQTFLTTHFADVQFFQAEREKDNGTITYEVELKNGVNAKFTEGGDWISVDCKFTLVPESIVELLPVSITTYLGEKHLDAKIMDIDKEMGGYEIGINNFVADLVFAADGTFIRYDY